MNQLKILILMSYYNRPILVKNSLNSIIKANDYHQNWELLFGDDNSKISGEPIAREILKDHLNKVNFVNSNISLEEKLENGITIGKFANEAIKKSDADIGIILCDDDELHPEYLRNLNLFFQNNINIDYCYSKIIIFNPLINDTSTIDYNIDNKYNMHNGPINPVGRIDASQVAWRLSCCKEKNAWFSETTKFVDGKPWTRDTDRAFFENLFEKCGECYPTNFISQYKGIHDYQLLWHKNVNKSKLKIYNKMCEELAGEKF